MIEEMNTALDSLRKLSVTEKLEIVEALWDDIGQSEEQLLLQDWHQEEAKRRAEELKLNPDLAITREELWARVFKRNV